MGVSQVRKTWEENKAMFKKMQISLQVIKWAVEGIPAFLSSKVLRIGLDILLEYVVPSEQQD